MPPVPLPQVTNTGAAIVEIYPNPAVDPFTIYLHDFKDVTALIAVYNERGQKVYNNKVTLIYGVVRLQIPVSSWPRGAYIVQVISAGKTVVKKFLK